MSFPVGLAILSALVSRAYARADCKINVKWCPSDLSAKCSCQVAPGITTTCASGMSCMKQGTVYNCVVDEEEPCTGTSTPKQTSPTCSKDDGALWMPPDSDPGGTCKCESPGFETDSECTAGQICSYGTCRWPYCPTGNQPEEPGAGQPVWSKKWCTSTKIHLIDAYYTDDQCTGPEFPIPPSPSGQRPAAIPLGECVTAEDFGGPESGEGGEGGPSHIIFSCEATKNLWDAKFYTDSSCRKEYMVAPNVPFEMPEEIRKLGCIASGDTSQFDVLPKCPGTDGKTAFNEPSKECECSSGSNTMTRCASGTACLASANGYPQCQHIFVGERDNNKCPLFPDQKCLCGYSNAKECGIGQSCVFSQTGGNCVTASVLPASAACKVPPRTIDYKLTHTIIIMGISPNTFNNNEKMIAAFRDAVARTLDVAPQKIPLGSIQAGSPPTADAPSPSVAPPSSSLAPSPSYTLRRRLEDGCAVSYDILAKDRKELNSFMSTIEEKMMCATCGSEFKLKLKTSMSSEGVVDIDSNSITVDTTTEPEDSTVTPRPSSDRKNIPPEDEGMDPGLIAVAVIVPVLVIATLVGAFFYMKSKRVNSGEVPDMELVKPDVRDDTMNPVSAVAMATAAPAASNAPTGPASRAAVAVTTTGTASTSASEYEMHMDKASGQAYYRNKTTGETTWENPAEGNKEWVRHVDPNSKKSYFQSKKTGRTTWTEHMN